MILQFIKCEACGLNTNVIVDKKQAEKEVSVCEVCEEAEEDESNTDLN